MQEPKLSENFVRIALYDQLDAADFDLKQNYERRQQVLAYRRRILEKLRATWDDAQPRLL